MEWQRRRRLKAMADGVTLVAPETVWFAHDTEIGRDCVVGHLACVHGARIGDRCLIGIHAVVLNGAVIGDDCLLHPHVSVRERVLIRRDACG